MKKFAFTLAEVLVTLSIIGVVCALTIPTLYKKHEERITISKVQNFYATLNSAYNAVISTRGPAKYWNTKPWSEDSANNLYEILFKPYFKIEKDCKTTNEGICILNDNYLTLLGGKHLNYTEKNDYYKILLKDGSRIFFRGGNPEKPLEFVGVYYDINGLKKPNKIGVDLFFFQGLNNQILPAGYNTFDIECKQHGLYCTAWAVYKGNLEYTRCEDLTWNGKQKCGKNKK